MGKKYLESIKLVNKDVFYDPVEAFDLVLKTSKANFDETVELHVRLGVDPRHADQQIRGTVLLPNGTGKKVKILVFAKGDKAKEAIDAGADYVGDEELLAKIQNQNWFDFDIVVATPDMMGELGKLGRILGPKGLMPNPKTGTVNPDIAKAVSEIKAGKVAYRVDKQGNINVCIGRASFDAQKLIENFKVLKDAIVKAKPATIKGNYIKNVAVTTTMGPGIKVDFSTF